MPVRIDRDLVAHPIWDSGVISVPTLMVIVEMQNREKTPPRIDCTESWGKTGSNRC